MAPEPILYGTVRSATPLSASMVRVVLDGPGLDGFEPTAHTDQYLSVLFPPDGAPYAVPFDPEEPKRHDRALRPKARRETVRAWDGQERLLTIDFVAHGDVGHAGRWAQRAQPGDRLQFAGPSGGYRPDPDADWHLLVGDESALPAIAASLEAVPPGARCVAVVVVNGPDDEIDLRCAGDLDVRWLHRSRSSEPSVLLVEAVAKLPWPSPAVDVFVHGEAGEVRAVRRHLLGERGVDEQRASISPYWRRGEDDEGWRQIKRTWIAEQATDV